MSKRTLEVQGDTQVVATRRFAAPPAEVYRAFSDEGTGTLMVMRMTLPDGPRAAMLETGMEHAVEASYVRLEGLLGQESPLR
jgi:uncharacterized protein YndB with AHSA1/START domain